jgi:hypothetical protein
MFAGDSFWLRRAGVEGFGHVLMGDLGEMKSILDDTKVKTNAYYNA